MMVTFGDMVSKETKTLSKTADKDAVVKGQFKVMKSDDEKRLAFGWASVAIDSAGNQLEDFQHDVLEPDVLEKAAYDFVLLYREGGEMHERGGCAVLVESMMFTKEKMAAMGIPEGTLPVGWWLGFYVTDDDVWEKVKSSEYPMFSIEGTAIREPTELEK